MFDYRHALPTEILFAEGAFGRLPHAAHRLGSRPLLVTGKHFARQSGLIDRALSLCPNAEVFDGVEENPAAATCEAGASRCTEARCDVIIGLGGGSAIDAAKAIAVLATNPGRCLDYTGREKFSAPPLPILAIPTTAGTGSEVTPYAVISDSENRRKRTIAGAALFPRIALLDPQLTWSLPQSVTLASGLDALSQAIEGYYSVQATPITDTLALEACRLIRHWLPYAVAARDFTEARAAMLHASLLAGIVIAHTGTTLVHGMGYYYTMEHGIPHGIANALLLAPVLRHTARHAPQRIANLAAALGQPCGFTPPEIPCNAITRAIHGLLKTLGVSSAAKDHGLPPDNFARWADEIANDDYRWKNQPGRLDARGIEALYRESWQGIQASSAFNEAPDGRQTYYPNTPPREISNYRAQ